MKRRIAQWEGRSERKGPGLPEEGDADRHTQPDPQARSSNQPELPIADTNTPSGSSDPAAGGTQEEAQDEDPECPNDLVPDTESEAETVPYDIDSDSDPVINRDEDEEDDDDYSSARSGAWTSQVEKAWAELL